MSDSGERLRHLETAESLGQVGPQHVAHWSNDTAITGAVQTVIPGGTQDVTAILTLLYAVQQIAGGGSAGGATTCIPGATVNLYNAGGNTLTVTVAAGGDATIATSAGVDTYNVSLLLLWI